MTQGPLEMGQAVGGAFDREQPTDLERRALLVFADPPGRRQRNRADRTQIN